MTPPPPLFSAHHKAQDALVRGVQEEALRALLAPLRRRRRLAAVVVQPEVRPGLEGKRRSGGGWAGSPRPRRPAPAPTRFSLLSQSAIAADVEAARALWRMT